MIVVVTGANGLVGSRMCAALARRGASVRAVVRRPGAAPVVRGVAEEVGDFADSFFAARVLAGADAAVTTVHPMGSGGEVQRRVGVAGTISFARAAAAAGVERLVHVSTAAVYDRSPSVGDVDECSPLVGDDAGDYAVTKRDADLALASVDGLTRVLLRPPAILGAGESSLWNAVRPKAIHDEEAARHAVPHQTFAWVHVDDLVAFAADAATGRVATSMDPVTGPVAGACTPVNVAAGPATVRDYHETVTRALGVTPVWDDLERGPAGCSPTAPTPGAGALRSDWQRRSTRSPRVCGDGEPPVGRRRRRPSGRCVLALRPTGARALTGAAGRQRRRERARADAGLAST